MTGNVSAGFALSVTVNLLSVAVTMSSCDCFVTFTLPSLSTVKVISVTARYPSGALTSWKVYVPGSSLIVVGLFVDVHCSTISFFSFKILILAPGNSSPPSLILLITTSLEL